MLEVLLVAAFVLLIAVSASSVRARQSATRSTGNVYVDEQIAVFDGLRRQGALTREEYERERTALAEMARLEAAKRAAS
jgi:hypothetical protein